MDQDQRNRHAPQSRGRSTERSQSGARSRSRGRSPPRGENRDRSRTRSPVPNPGRAPDAGPPAGASAAGAEAATVRRSSRGHQGETANVRHHLVRPRNADAGGGLDDQERFTKGAPGAVDEDRRQVLMPTLDQVARGASPQRHDVPKRPTYGETGPGPRMQGRVSPARETERFTYAGHGGPGVNSMSGHPRGVDSINPAAMAKLVLGFTSENTRAVQQRLVTCHGAEGGEASNFKQSHEAVRRALEARAGGRDNPPMTLETTALVGEAYTPGDPADAELALFARDAGKKREAAQSIEAEVRNNKNMTGSQRGASPIQPKDLRPFTKTEGDGSRKSMWAVPARKASLLLRTEITGSGAAGASGSGAAGASGSGAAGASASGSPPGRRSSRRRPPG